MTAQEPTNADQTPLERELVGHIWVDSGQLLLTDPGYAEDLDYETIDTATDKKHRHAVLLDGMAMVFRSGLRNSRYPVYVTRFENGAIFKIEIEMTEPLE